MVISKLISGLGNQLFQYTIGRELSIKWETNLKLDTSFFLSQNLRSFKLQYYNINAEIATSQEVDRLTGKYFNHSVKNKIFNKLDSIFSNQKTYHSEREWWIFEKEILEAPKNVYIDGYWQHYKYFERINPIILDELTIKKDYFSNISKQLSQILNCQAVSVHIRRGDYITDKEAFNLMGILPISYYRQAIEIINSKLFSPIYFFFSDDIEWVKKEFADVKNAFFLEGFKDYEDLTLMSHCQHNIIANSSFSWWGAFLNKTPDKIIIGPKNWVVDQSINSKIEIMPPSWEKL